MNHRNWFIIMTAILATLLMSSALTTYTPTVQPAEAQSLSRAERNWENVNHNGHATNHNPQNQINKDNIKFLELKWAYPLPSVSTVSDSTINYGGALIGGLVGQISDGSITPPLVVDGIVYIATNYFRLYAIDATTGNLIWQKQLEIDVSEKMKTLPLAGSAGHLHAIAYEDGWVMFTGLACDIYAFDALSGDLAWHLEDTCANVTGNNGLYTGGLQSYPPRIHQPSNTLVLTSSVVDGYTGRGYVRGYDLDTRQLKWTAYTAPPAGLLGTPAREEWGQYLVDNCAKIWIQSVSSCDIPRDLLRNDWGDNDCMDVSKYYPEGVPYGEVGDCLAKSGTGTVWGQMSVDDDAGIIYMGTSQPTIDWNASLRPGPNLFSNAVVAIDIYTGDMVWAHQQNTHDLWDVDCSWNTVLGNIGSRKVVYKNCKMATTAAMDAATGELIWFFNAAADGTLKFSPYKPHHPDSKLCDQGTGKRDYSFIGCWDPRQRATLEMPWQNWPSTDQFWESSNSGSTDLAFDGDTIYTRIVNGFRYRETRLAELGQAGHLGVRTIRPGPEGDPRSVAGANTTFFALNAATGEVRWSYFLAGSHRTGASISGGMVFLSHSDGTLYILDKDNGELLYEKNFGQGLNIYPTIGADGNGDMKIFQIIGGSRFGQGTPGALMSWGLNEFAVEAALKAAPEIQRVNVPGPERIVDRVVEVEREVIREVEVPVEVVIEKVKEVQVDRIVEQEVIKEVEVVRTEEVISPISYIAIGVGVVLVVVSAILFARKRTT